MTVVALVGAQFGDEGKGKEVDRRAVAFDIVARFGGGPNAGHTLRNEFGEIKLHLVPSGICHQKTVNVIGAGVAVDPQVLIAEIEMLSGRVDPRCKERILVSNRANLLLPYHQALDLALEARRGARSIGTTGRGIGPCFADRVSRNGLLIGNLLELDRYQVQLYDLYCETRHFVEDIYARFSIGADPSSGFPGFEVMMENLRSQAEFLRPLITDTGDYLRSANRQGKRLLLEGAQGTLIDLYEGTYPFVSSSSATSAGSCLGSGLPPSAISQCIGISKAYTTRVGAGPFPTELNDEIGERLRQEGAEFGTTTGRARRCGWLDIPTLRLAIEVNGISRMVLNKLDILSGFPNLRIAIAYPSKTTFHDTLTRFEHSQPEYEDLPGWEEPIRGLCEWHQLPKNAQRYVERIQELLEVPIDFIGTGPNRNEGIQL